MTTETKPLVAQIIGMAVPCSGGYKYLKYRCPHCGQYGYTETIPTADKAQLPTVASHRWCQRSAPSPEFRLGWDLEE